MTLITGSLRGCGEGVGGWISFVLTKFCPVDSMSK